MLYRIQILPIIPKYVIMTGSLCLSVICHFNIVRVTLCRIFTIMSVLHSVCFVQGILIKNKKKVSPLTNILTIPELVPGEHLAYMGENGGNGANVSAANGAKIRIR